MTRDAFKKKTPQVTNYMGFVESDRKKGVRTRNKKTAKRRKPLCSWTNNNFFSCRRTAKNRVAVEKKKLAGRIFVSFVAVH